VKENNAMNILVPTPPSQEITKSRRIGFLIYPDCEICDVCGPLDVFHFANFSLPRFGRTDEPGYQLVILAATPGPVRTHCGIEIIATQSWYDIKDGLDTLVVSGGINVEQACKDNPGLVEWVRAMAPRARRVTQQSRRKSAQAITRDEHIGVLVQQCDHEHLFGVVATCRCS
jgi:transcriptional regulator GlxA family with amidase domain